MSRLDFTFVGHLRWVPQRFISGGRWHFLIAGIVQVRVPRNMSSMEQGARTRAYMILGLPCWQDERVTIIQVRIREAQNVGNGDRYITLRDQITMAVLLPYSFLLIMIFMGKWRAEQSRGIHTVWMEKLASATYINRADQMLAYD